MHISEGVLSAPVLLVGGVAAAAGVVAGLRKLEYDHIVQVGLTSAAFFIASLVHVPVGPVSVHLIMNGLVGLLLGWAAVPAILVALVLQAVFFQFGGITALGVNTVIMALPAVVCGLMAGAWIRRHPRRLAVAAFGCGAGAVFFSALLMAASLVFTEEDFMTVARLAILAHVPVMIIDGLITAFCVIFLRKVQPELLPGPDVWPQE